MTVKPAFVIGVTGKMTFPEYDLLDSDPDNLGEVSRSIYNRVQGILRWIRHETDVESPKGRLDLVTGEFDPEKQTQRSDSRWAPLGLKHTPIVLLTSLAPGADTIVAEAVLDFAEAEKKKAEETGVEYVPVLVRAALPFHPDVYKDSSTFDPSDSTPVETRARQDRFESVLNRVKDQGEGFVEERDIFHVELHAELLGSPPANAEDDLDATSPGGQPRRRLRYRAAGDFIATYSDLLLAVYDPDQATKGKPENVFSCGTETIIETKREGLTYGVLPGDNAFSWADNGPVLQIPIPTEGNGEVNPQPMKMLHPYDSVPPGKVKMSRTRMWLCALKLSHFAKEDPIESPRSRSEEDTGWQESGNGFFRRILKYQERFNSKDANEREEGELQAMLSPTDGAKPCPGFELTEGATSYLGTLDELARVRCRAKLIARQLKSDRQGLMVRLVWWILAAAAFLGFYEHWKPKSTGVYPWLIQEWGGVIASLLLLLTVMCAARCAWLFKEYLAKDAERERFDYRALAEGLRVQVSWSAAGVPHSVDSHYMQRQRSEMDWIRYVIAALNNPPEYRRRKWQKLTKDDKVSLLEAVRLSWVREQCSYTRTTKQESQGKADFWHHWGWVFTAAGFLNILGKLLAEVSPWVHHQVELYWGWIGGALAVAAASLLGVSARRSKSENKGHGHPSPKAPFFKWLLGRPMLWSWALLVALGPFAMPHILESAYGALPGNPGWAGLWKILTGICLLIGALSLAWSERNMFGESARQNQALENLFQNADRRLERLIQRYKNASSGSSDEERALKEAQNILFQLGCEALHENTEWLILHRTRPLEPFLAG